MDTLTILAIALAAATAGVTFLACEDVTACFVVAFLAFIFFWVIGSTMLTLMPEFTNTFIVAPAQWLFDKIATLLKHLFAWTVSRNPLS